MISRRSHLPVRLSKSIDLLFGSAFNSLVVMTVDSMLRRATGRKLESSDFTTRHLSGRSVRVLAFGLALLPLASRMTTRERAAGNPQNK